MIINYDRTMDTPKYIVNVEAAIFKDNKWLMILRSSKESHAAGTISMVGGKVEFDDNSNNTLEEALKREVLEEVGVVISDKMSYVESKSFVTNLGNHVMDIVFLCEYVSGSPKANSADEVEEVSWYTLEEIKQNEKTPPWILQSIQKAQELL